MENKNLLTSCPSGLAVFTDEATFLAELGDQFTDGYENPAYAAGDVLDSASIDLFSDGAISAIESQTSYIMTNGDNITTLGAAFGGGRHFILPNLATITLTLDFTSASASTPDGVFGAGFYYNGTTTNAVTVTLGDNSQLTCQLDSTTQTVTSLYFGVTSSESIKSFQISVGNFAFDDLTVGASAQPAAPMITDISDAVEELLENGDIGNLTAIVLLNRLERADQALESGNEERAIRILQRTNRLIDIGVFFGLISQADGAELSDLTDSVIDSIGA